MPKRTIYSKNSQALQSKKRKDIERDIFNCLLNNRSQKPLSQKEIATEIGCSPSTISRQIKSLLNAKRQFGKQYYSIRWTIHGYIMEREDTCESQYDESDSNNYREELIYDLAEKKICTMNEISIITSTVIFCGVVSKLTDTFNTAFRSIFPEDYYHDIVRVEGGVYVILKEVAKKELHTHQEEIAEFYEDIVKEMENIKCKKILSPNKTIEKNKKHGS